MSTEALAEIAAEIDTIQTPCSAERVTYGGRVREPCKDLAAVSLTVVCSVHGAMVGHALCTDHHEVLRGLIARGVSLHTCSQGGSLAVTTGLL